ncbi:MAG: hypothetical protein ACN6OX_08960 [Pseudomonas sp.]
MIGGAGGNFVDKGAHLQPSSGKAKLFSRNNSIIATADGRYPRQTIRLSQARLLPQKEINLQTNISKRNKTIAY